MFKTRHGIRKLSIQGEKLSAAEESVKPFLQKLHKLTEEKNVIPEQIYNADETGLLGKCLPQRTHFLSRKICSRIQKSKGSFTCNCAGLYKYILFSLLYTFCLHFFLINIHIFSYPHSWLSGSTVFIMHPICTVPLALYLKMEMKYSDTRGLNSPPGMFWVTVSCIIYWLTNLLQGICPSKVTYWVFLAFRPTKLLCLQLAFDCRVPWKHRLQKLRPQRLKTHTPQRKKRKKDSPLFDIRNSVKPE